MPDFEQKLIEVCDKCLQATCWHGLFFCGEHMDAGTTLKTVAELRKLALENPEYWSDEHQKEIYGEPAPYGYRHEDEAENDKSSEEPVENKLLKACQMAYKKHHKNDDSIGWDELSDTLCDALCESMGDDEFVKWNERPTDE